MFTRLLVTQPLGHIRVRGSHEENPNVPGTVVLWYRYADGSRGVGRVCNFQRGPADPCVKTWPLGVRKSKII